MDNQQMNGYEKRVSKYFKIRFDNIKCFQALHAPNPNFLGHVQMKFACIALSHGTDNVLPLI